jgi:uncharacterized protein (TIGR03086 family)
METTETNPTASSTDLDPRPLFAISARTANAVISWVTPDQLDRPTPCAAFAVRDLLDHLVLVAPRIASLGRGTPDYSSHDGGTAGWTLTDMATAFSTGIADAEQAWADPESLTRLLTLPWATMPGADVLRMYLSELTVHTWDLARATRQRPEWDADVVAESLAFMKVALPPEIRGDADDAEVPFAPVIETAADAPLIDQLVAWTGRNPAWS